MPNARLLALAALLPAAALPQDETALKRYFEGKRVVVKIEMPATKDGIDVHYGRPAPIDFRAYSQDIRQHGLAVRPGDSLMITLIKVKPNLIEFQLGGGGYGKFGDETATRERVHTAKSRREKDLEQRLKKLPRDSDEAREVRDELGEMRQRRERRDEHAQEAADEAYAAKAAIIDQRARESGSRFNIRFPKDYLKENPPTPELIVKTLAEWVDFAPPQ